MKERIEEIDWLRGFATFLVILGHSIIVYPINLHEIPWCNVLYEFISSFHMPLFFVISGFCCQKVNRGGYRTYLLKKAKRLLIPWGAFSVISFLPRIVFPNLVNNEVESLQDSILGILLYGEGYWFLYVLFLIFLIFPIISWALDKAEVPTLATVFLLSVISGLFPSIFAIDEVCYYMAFFLAGFVARKKNIFKLESKMQTFSRGKQTAIFIIAIVAIIIVEFIHIRFSLGWFNVIAAFIVIISSFIYVLSCKECVFKWFKKYSPYSLALWLLNGYLLVVSRTLVVNILHIENAFVIILINMIIDFFGSYVLIKYVFSKIPIMRTILGIRVTNKRYE